MTVEAGRVGTPSPSTPGQSRSGIPCIRQLNSQTTEAWNRYAAAHPRGTLYHTTRWRDLVTRLYRYETYYLHATDTTESIVGILPLVRLKSRLFGDFMVSLPQVNFGGAIGDDETTEQALMIRAGEIAEERGVEHIEFRDMTPRAGDWPCRTDKVLMERALPPSKEQLWKALGSKLRAQIRRPQKEGAVVVRGGGELISDFYRVFSHNMRDLGTPVYSRGFFTAIAKDFPEAAAVRPTSFGMLRGR